MLWHYLLLFILTGSVKSCWKELIENVILNPSSTPSPTTAAPSGPCQCGVSTILKTTDPLRIVGGEETQPAEIPWQVAQVYWNGQLMCGGSLLSSRTVITAAHCITPNSQVTVVLGRSTFNPATGISYTSSNVEVHPNYNSGTNDYDFAIITLSRDVTFSDSVRTICLPASGASNDEGKNGVISGWGTTNSGGSVSNNLLKANVMTQSASVCLSQYSSITARMLCAAAPGRDTCQGDSGGPLIVKSLNGKNFELIGVTSFGKGCADPKYAGVYARVSSVLPWITGKLTGSTCPPP